MNYEKVYKDLISSAQLRPDIPFLNGYTETHHIIPRSMGGTDDSNNLVKLTAREHFIAHWLLWRIYKTNNMAYAFHAMSMGRKKNKKRYLNSRGYEEARKAMSAAKLGISLSEEHKSKIGAKSRGRKHSAETKAKMSASMKGIPKSPEHIKKIADARKGMKYSEETLAKRSASLKGKKLPPRSKEHCEKISANAKERWRRKKLNN